MVFFQTNLFFKNVHFTLMPTLALASPFFATVIGETLIDNKEIFELLNS